MHSLKKSFAIAALSAVAVLAGVSASAYASSFGPQLPGQMSLRPVPPGTHKLTLSVLHTGSGGSLAAGFNTIDSTSFSCGNAAGCTYGFNTMVQVGPQSASGVLWAICAVADGNYASPGCPYQGAIPTTNYSVGGSRQSITVSQGTHTLSIQVYVGAASTLGEFETDYLQYKP